MSNKKVAFVISGAAAFIPQELACIRAVMESTYAGSSGEKITPVVMAGTSSGSLCTALVNGVLAGTTSWDEIENEIIPSIGDAQVFEQLEQEKLEMLSFMLSITKGAVALHDLYKLYNELKDFYHNYSEMKTLEIIKKIADIAYNVYSTIQKPVISPKEFRKAVENVKPILEKYFVKRDFHWPSWEELLHVFNQVLYKGHILNTEPLVNTIETYVNKKLKFKNMGELPCRTFISAVSNETGLTKRFDSKNRRDARTSLKEVLLASTAIPVVFPPRAVNDALFVDGGTGTDNFPVADVLGTGEKFDEVYVFTFHNTTILNEPLAHTDSIFQLLNNGAFALKVLYSSLVPFQLAQAINIVHDPRKAFLYMPILSEKFNMLDFNSMPRQLELTKEFTQKEGPKKIIDVLRKMDFPIGVLKEEALVE